MGFDTAADSIRKGESALLLLAKDLSERSAGSAAGIAAQNAVETVTVDFSMAEIGQAVGRKQTGIISINDTGFAKSVKALCTENSQEECI